MNLFDHQTRVLFLCVGNSARSQMAEAILRAKAGSLFEVYSAGLEPSEVRPEALAVLTEAGYSTDGLRSKGVDEYLGKVHFTYLVTVCSVAEDRCPRTWLPGGERLYWPIDDPAAADGPEDERMDAFRIALRQIEAKIDDWLTEISE